MSAPDGRTLTQLVVVVAVLAMTVYDLYAFRRYGTCATISVSLYEWSQAHPVIAFALGFLAGHVFWPHRT